MIRDLDRVGLDDRREVGGKAAVLGELRRRKLPVPPGFVVVDVDRWEQSIRSESSDALPPWARETKQDGWIARSSAPMEDGTSASFAGQFHSVAGLRGSSELIAGVREVSENLSLAQTYAGSELPAEEVCRVPVLVQPMIRPLRAGVLFTVDPLAQQRNRFAIDWTDASQGLVTDGASQGNFRVFDPLASKKESIGDAVVRAVLNELVDIAFDAMLALGEARPFDIEWLVDRERRLWIVQARPVTTARPQARKGVSQLLDEGFWLASKRPVCRLAVRAFEEAAKSDELAASYYHASFVRKTVSCWLLGKRIKRRPRPRLKARTPAQFFLRFLWLRRKNLVFALRHTPSWIRACKRRAPRAERILSTDLTEVSDGRLTTDLTGALDDYFVMRRVHAALWYPVDLAKDVEEFGRRFGLTDLAKGIALPARRVRRDDDARRLLEMTRATSGGAHPSWTALAPGDRRRVRAHLARYPYSFECAEEVQDLSSWTSHAECPERWWSSHARMDTASRATESQCDPKTNERRQSSPFDLLRSTTTALWGEALKALPGYFAPIKDDRAEMLALFASALRATCIEAEERANRRRERAKGWVFELEPEELLELARGLRKTSVVERFEGLARYRMRARILEEISSCGDDEQAGEAEAAAVGGGDASPIHGLSIGRGVAVGHARVVRNVADALSNMKSEEVLVAEEVRPAFSQVVRLASALVCRQGSPLSHGAIVAREFGIPAVVIGDAITRIRDGVELVVDGNEGRVYVR